MVNSAQRDILAIHGYRVVHTARGDVDGAQSVEYPNERPDAYMKRFSLVIFATADEAWDHAWGDYNAGRFATR